MSNLEPCTAINYLKKFLDLYLFSSPKDSLSGISEHINAVRQKTISAVNSKRPGRLPLSADWNAIIAMLQIDAGLEATFLYLLQRDIFLKESSHPILPMLANLSRLRTGIEIYYSTEIGEGFNIQHGCGIVIGPRCKIGRNFIIHQGVTIGQKHLNSPDETAKIGDDVTIFAGAKILGNVHIGNGTQVAANAVVLSDLEAHSIYAGVPARKVGTVKQTSK